MTEPKMNLIKFGADYCAPCKAMDKSRLLERFAEKHSNVTVEKISIADKEGSSDSEPYAKAFKRADIFGIDALPTLILEDERGGELARVEGGVTMRDLESLYERAKSRAELRTGKYEDDEDGLGEDDVDDEDTEDEEDEPEEK